MKEGKRWKWNAGRKGDRKQKKIDREGGMPLSLPIGVVEPDFAEDFFMQMSFGIDELQGSCSDAHLCLSRP